MALFTTYLSALRKVKFCAADIFPTSGICVKILYVMRKRGNDAVAPSLGTLKWYKERQAHGVPEAFEIAKKDYLYSLLNSEEAKEWIDKIAKETQYTDIFLVCYEKDPDLCHRTLLAQQIVFRHPEVKFLGEVTDFQNRPKDAT